MEPTKLHEDPKLGDPAFAQSAAEDGAGSDDRADGLDRDDRAEENVRDEIEDVIEETQTPG